MDLSLRAGAGMAWLFGSREAGKFGLSAQQLSKLLTFAPIEPAHAMPVSLEANGIASLVTDDDRAFFDDFREFGRIFNRLWLKEGPWRLQERDDAHLMLSDYDGPEHGRTYDVFYNQVRLGRLELSASFDLADGLAAYSLRRVIRLQLSVHTPLALPYSSITEFLNLLASFAASRDAADLAQQYRIALDALQAILWDAVQSGSYGMPLEICWHGHAASYFRARDVERENR